MSINPWSKLVCLNLFFKNFYSQINIIYIVIKEKPINNIFKVKIFRLLPSIHNLSLYKFRFEGHIRLNSYRASSKVVQGTNRTRFNFSNKDWQYTNNNDNIEIGVKQKNNASIMIIITIILLMQMITAIKLTATVII